VACVRQEKMEKEIINKDIDATNVTQYGDEKQVLK